MKKIISIFLIGLFIINVIGNSALSIRILPENYCSKLENYDMVIIAPEIFSTNIQPLLNHKNSIGIETYLKKTEEIYLEYNGRDQAEKIKFFIKDSIEKNGITYVLLIGGMMGQSLKWFIPVRYVNNRYHITDSDYYHKKFISDLYFADIYKENGDFEDWDSNGNGIYAEWIDYGEPEDILDLKPDIYLGRLPCRSNYEVKVIVDKIIKYENTVYNEKWLNDILLIGGDSFPGLGEPYPFEGEESCEWVLNYLDGRPPRCECGCAGSSARERRRGSSAGAPGPRAGPRVVAAARWARPRWATASRSVRPVLPWPPGLVRVTTCALPFCPGHAGPAGAQHTTTLPLRKPPDRTGPYRA